VKVSDGCESLDEVKFGVIFFHASDFSKEVEEFSAVAVFHAKYEVVGSFEAEVELCDKGVSDARF
jgi:hypothetical protein